MRQTFKRISQLISAPASHRRAVLRGILATPGVARSVRSRGYAGTRQWLEGRPRPDLGMSPSDVALRRADTAIRHLPWRVRCLERSLVVWWLAGESAEIRLGVAPGLQGQPHRFHAWVEREGTVLNDSANVSLEFLPLVGRSAEAADPLQFD